jgi:cysteine rich repeat protein
MGQPHSSGHIFTWIFTVVGLGIVWLAILMSLPSQQDLSAKEPRLLQQPVPTPKAQLPSEPTLDLSIPGVPSAPPAPPDQDPSASIGASALLPEQLDPREAQVARLRCEAEIEQLCPDSLEGLARRRCLEKRGQQLAVPCQQQLRERFVKWKEERTRLVMACQADVKRWCASVKPGDGQILQCLQDHAQEVSDRCYETLPKGTVYFKQQGGFPQ